MQLSEAAKYIHNASLLSDGCFHAIALMSDVADDNTLIYMDQEVYMNTALSDRRISCMIVSPGIAQKLLKEGFSGGILQSEQPAHDFYMLHNSLFRETDFYSRKKVPTVIGENCNIDSHAVISPYNVIIGDHTTVEAAAVILEDTEIGENCYIGHNVVIGGRGFQYKGTGLQTQYVEHIGKTLIGNRVDIFPGTCIARGMFKPTVIEDDVKIDNLVHIAHSVHLEQGVILTGGVVIGGSAYLCKGTWVGLNATICHGVHVGEHVTVCMGAAVTKSVEDGKKVSGNFAVDHDITLANLRRMLS